MPAQLDEVFTALPLDALTDAALTRARELGTEHADIRVERIRTANLALHDARLETSHDDDERGVAVRVVHDGVWGFAAGVALSPDAVRGLVDDAVEIAKISRPVTAERIELAAEPAHGEQQWVSAYDVDPFDVPESERAALLEEWSRQLLNAAPVHHADATLKHVRENKYYADLSGTRTTQQRVRIQAEFTALWVDERTGRFESMRTRTPGRQGLGAHDRHLRLGR